MNACGSTAGFETRSKPRWRAQILDSSNGHAERRTDMQALSSVGALG
jgi:hypothetical protein